MLFAGTQKTPFQADQETGPGCYNPPQVPDNPCIHQSDLHTIQGRYHSPLKLFPHLQKPFFFLQNPSGIFPLFEVLLEMAWLIEEMEGKGLYNVKIMEKKINVSTE